MDINPLDNILQRIYTTSVSTSTLTTEQRIRKDKNV